MTKQTRLFILLCSIFSPSQILIARGIENQISVPQSIACDSRGNLFIADSGENVVRRLNRYKEWSTSVGTEGGLSGPQGLVVDGAGNLLIADTNNNAIRYLVNGSLFLLAGSLGIAGHVDGIGQSARFNHPTGLALDPGREVLYIADSGNHVLRSLDLVTGNVTTLAGVFNRPTGIAFDAHRNVIYVAETGRDAISAIGLNELHPRTLAGGQKGFVDGTATASEFNQPTGLAFQDTSQTLYVADSENHIIRRLDLSNYAVTVLAGADQAGFVDGSGELARFESPVGIAIDALRENLYVADPLGHKVRRLNLADGFVSTISGQLMINGLLHR